MPKLVLVVIFCGSEESLILGWRAASEARSQGIVANKWTSKINVLNVLID